MPEVTVLYAGLIGLLSLVLSFKAGSLRGKLEIPLGDGGNPEMLLAMRRHANFVEYAPLGLILIALLEMNAVSALAIHTLGAALLVFRVVHAYGLNATATNNSGRVVGAAGTALVMLVASLH